MYINTHYNAKFRSNNHTLYCKVQFTDKVICASCELLPASVLFVYVMVIRDANTKEIICAVVNVSGSS